MRWSRTQGAQVEIPGVTRIIVPAVLALLIAAALVVAAAPDERKISIYSTAANYSLPVIQKSGQDYVGLLEILEPLGTVNAKTEGSHWRFRFNDTDSEFTVGKSRARVKGQDLDLSAKFQMENGRGLVPLTSLTTLLPRFLGGPVTFHESARRLFVGSVAVHFTAQVSKANPPQLVMDFSSPVNPSLAAESGRLRMVFTHEALVPAGAQTLTFESKVILSAVYDESNGAAEITVNGTAPLFASFSNDGRTITISPAPQASAQAQPPAVGFSPSPPPPSLNAPFSPPVMRHYFAVIDASHGGDERGAALGDQMAEKDVTLAFARRLRQELENRGLPTLLTRDSDITMTLDQRANSTNSVHPAIFLCLHASSQGIGVRLYSALVPAVGESHGMFVSWDSAQSLWLAATRTAQASMDSELRKIQVPVRDLSAPLRPLNNVTAPAIAIEVAPQNGDVGQLNSASYQQQIAGAVAAGIVDVRGQLEAKR